MAKRRREVVLIGHLHDPKAESLLRKRAQLKILTEPPSERTLRKKLTLAHGVMVRTPFRLTGSVISNSKNLLVISSSGRGTDNIDVKTASQRNIAVVNAPDVGRVPVAEHTLAFMLALSKGLVQNDIAVKQGMNWNFRQNIQPVELAGKTLAIIGLGKIGSEVARKCHQNFGMKVLAYDPYIGKAYAQRVGANLANTLEELLPRADFLSIHAALTPETKGMLGRKEFEVMKTSAFLINTARGSIINERELSAALQNHQLAGAALDVFDPEPPKKTFLLKLRNVILSPHIAGLTPEARRATSFALVRQVMQVFQGEKPQHIVNPQIWPALKKRI
ncbi:MAG: hydroxyacid dehydrogenase [Candidatus Bathyarchaeia archaeon]